MPTKIEFTQRLKKIYARTKVLCFGRYAIEVPGEAQLIWGGASFPSDIDVKEGSESLRKQQAAEDIDKLKWENSSADICYEGVGPTPESWQIRYYDSDAAKKFGLYIFNTYISKGNLMFVLYDATRENENENTVIARQTKRSESLRLRSAEEIPTDPGYCIKHGFMAGDTYKDQEMVNVGVYFPSFPDLTFSISSNKDAYGDYSAAEFENRLRPKLSLLNRIKEAQDAQGIRYPKRTMLREGKRSVQHWLGEESLFKRKDGTHDFEWALVGTPRDVANPSEFHATMFTKVAHNTVGAAEKASLTDDEAVALWDKLLSGLKFRVKVPGAPEGSYYFLPGAKADAGAKP